jgi:hypothetical protein
LATARCCGSLATLAVKQQAEEDCVLSDVRVVEAVLVALIGQPRLEQTAPKGTRVARQRTAVLDAPHQLCERDPGGLVPEFRMDLLRTSLRPPAVSKSSQLKILA